MAPVASEEQRATIESCRAIATEQGGMIVSSGDRLRKPTEGSDLEPALIIGTTPDMRVNREEILGSVACAIRVVSTAVRFQTTGAE